MKTKAKSIMERYGFTDPDRKKPSHDEIQIWVYKNFIQIVYHLFPHVKIDESIPLDLRLEYAVSETSYNRKFIIGFIDVYCLRYGIAVEVKTEIPVVGELIRQIQFYRNYISCLHWVVVSPDEKSADVLREQGIHFFKYDRGGLELFPLV